MDKIEVGISAILTCFEMSIFGFVHIKAFSYLPYRAASAPISPPTGRPDFDPSGPNSFRYKRTSRASSMKDVLDLRDLCKEVASGSKYLSRKLQGLDGELDRHDDFEVALGKPRRSMIKEKTCSMTDYIVQEEMQMISSNNKVMEEIEDRLRRVKEMGTEDFEVVEPASLSQARPCQKSAPPSQGLRLIMSEASEVGPTERRSSTFGRAPQEPSPIPLFSPNARRGLAWPDAHPFRSPYGALDLDDTRQEPRCHDSSLRPRDLPAPRSSYSHSSRSMDSAGAYQYLPSLVDSTNFYDPFDSIDNLRHPVSSLSVLQEHHTSLTSGNRPYIYHPYSANWDCTSRTRY